MAEARLSFRQPRLGVPKSRASSASLSPRLEDIGGGKSVDDMADIAHEGKGAAPFHQKERQAGRGAMMPSALNQVNDPQLRQSAIEPVSD